MTFSIPNPLAAPSDRKKRLRDLLAGSSLISAPGVFDCLTARIVERAGFSAAYITGSGVSITRIGAPDVAVISFGEVLDQIRGIADSTSLPLIADADTGYGGPLSIIRTVREFEKAGVAAIQLEDQELPKRCGHELGRRVVDTPVMVDRIKAATDTRRDDNFVVVARTDARTPLGLDAAIERAQAYAEAGADVIFVESPESEEEMLRINQQVQAPTLANLVEGGRTPILTAEQLTRIGYRVAIYPNSLTRLFGHMGARLMAELKATGTTAGMSDSMLSHRELWDLFDYPDWIKTESQYRMG